MRLSLLLLSLAACTSPDPSGDGAGNADPDPGPEDPADPVDPPEDTEEVPGVTPHEPDGIDGEGVDVIEGGAEPDPNDDNQEWFFEDGTVREFRFTLTQGAINGLNQHNDEIYFGGTFESASDGIVMENTGFQLKGSSTYQTMSGKPSFKIKFFDEKLHGERRLTLHNQMYDPSYMSEYLSYMAFRLAGVPATRVGYANVYVNDELYGLYTIIETFDENFTAQNFADGEGNMYEIMGDITSAGNFLVEEPGIPEDGSNVQAFVAGSKLTGTAFLDAMRVSLDWDNVLKYLAMEIVIGHWDGYQGNQNNIHMYHEPTLDLWYFSPWSTDLAFAWSPWSGGKCGNYEPSWSNGRLGSTCRQNAACKAELYAAILEAADLVESVDWDAEIDALDARLWSSVAADPRRVSGTTYSMQDYEDQKECIREWVKARPAKIRALYGG